MFEACRVVEEMGLFVGDLALARVYIHSSHVTLSILPRKNKDEASKKSLNSRFLLVPVPNPATTDPYS